MPIYFIPNDPQAKLGPPKRKITPLRYPTGAAAIHRVQPSATAGLYPVLTPKFDYWQTQTALVLGLRNWREIAGGWLPKWQGNRRVLPVRTNGGTDLNAYYDRTDLSFFEYAVDGHTYHTCESVDVVTHEQGHAFLDALRPDFWDAPFAEVGAFHEAFGDCMSMLVALGDTQTRTRVLAQTPNLSAKNFVEGWGEDLGDGIRRADGPSYADPGAARRSLNRFRWVDPKTLPTDAPSSKLANEAHSFARVFTGCFWDTIRGLFAAGAHTSAGLSNAALTAGRLLVAAVQTVPLTPRLFEGVGRRMVQADLEKDAGAHAAIIRAAFARHGITLGAPATSLAEPIGVRRLAAAGAARAIRGVLAAPAGARLELTPVESEMHGAIAHVSAYAQESLGAVGLPGLHIQVPATARVQLAGRAVAGLLGATSDVEEGLADAQRFAAGLVKRGQVEGAAPRGAARRRTAKGQKRAITHAVRSIRGKRTIVRVRFACDCCR